MNITMVISVNVIWNLKSRAFLGKVRAVRINWWVCVEWEQMSLYQYSSSNLWHIHFITYVWTEICLCAKGPSHSTGLAYHHVGHNPVWVSSASANNINKRSTIPTQCLDNVCCRCVCFSTHFILASIWACMCNVNLYLPSFQQQHEMLHLCCLFSTKRVGKSAPIVCITVTKCTCNLWFHPINYK